MNNSARIGQLLVTGVDHIGVVVADLEPVIALFSAIPMARVETPVDHPELSLEILFVHIGGVRIEFLRPLGPGRAQDLVDAGRAGLHHLALGVSDLDLALEIVKGRGFELVDETGRPGAHGTRIAFLDSSTIAGTAIELVEHPGRDDLNI
jgi:methylmalonyl-CoA/ethylmalonyl-CoA epimerase